VAWRNRAHPPGATGGRTATPSSKIRASTVRAGRSWGTAGPAEVRFCWVAALQSSGGETGWPGFSMGARTAFPHSVHEPS
jgi:hypothetical protein